MIGRARWPSSSRRMAARCGDAFWARRAASPPSAPTATMSRADASRPGQSLLLLLDSLQPVGVSTVILDQNNLLPLLGAAAAQNSILPVQVIESGAFLSIGTTVVPVVSATYGTPILRASLAYENGAEARVDLKYGSLEILPLSSGEAGRLTIKCLRGADIGFGPGRGGTIPVTGGAQTFDG